MDIMLKDSKTKINVMRAFAGESQAYNRYKFAADEAKRQKLQVIEHIFRFTANQETAHAKVYYDFLASLSGENILADGHYPVDISGDVLKLLRLAQHNEYQEYEHEYSDFSRIAGEEGFTKISTAFRNIAAIEKTHGDRFAKYADLLEQNKLFTADDENQEWMCLNCGHIYKGKTAPTACPVCDHPQGYFIRLADAPYQN